MLHADQRCGLGSLDRPQDAQTMRRSLATSPRRLPRLFAAGSLAALVGTMLALASPASAGTPADAIARLNAQRAANGIPAGIVERPDWSDACARHNDYRRQNGTMGHDEDPARPSYSPEGAWAGQNSVLASGSDWNAANPWENAPIHLGQVLSPRLAQMGVDDSGGYVCATTFPGMTRAPAGKAGVSTYPGDGREEVPYAQNASESPFVPGDFVGLPQGTTTGPNLLVLVDGPWSSASACITSASVTGPDGPVEVRWVDNQTNGIGPYLATGGVVIPTQPLRSSTAYTTSVTLAVGQTTVSHSWSFTTASGPAPPPPTGPAPGGQPAPPCAGTPPVPPSAGTQPVPPSAGARGSGKSSAAARLPQWIDIKRRTIRAGRKFVLRYQAADRGRMTVRLIRGGRTISRSSLTVVRGGRGEIGVPSGQLGRYKLRASLDTSRTTSFSATVTAQR